MAWRRAKVAWDSGGMRAGHLRTSCCAGSSTTWRPAFCRSPPFNQKLVNREAAPSTREILRRQDRGAWIFGWIVGSLHRFPNVDSERAHAGEPDCVTIGRSLCDRIHAQDTTGPWSVLNHDRLTQISFQRWLESSRDSVSAAAGREWNVKANGFVWKDLRSRLIGGYVQLP